MKNLIIIVLIIAGLAYFGFINVDGDKIKATAKSGASKAKSAIESSETFKAIHVALKWLKRWEGTLTAESQVGQGMSFELRLRSFI